MLTLYLSNKSKGDGVLYTFFWAIFVGVVKPHPALSKRKVSKKN